MVYVDGIPLQVGQIGSLANVSVTRNSDNVELACDPSTVGIHPNGDPLVLRLRVEVASATSQDIACTLHFNRTRTNTLTTGATEMAFPATITAANRFTVAYTTGMIACTDANHLCRSDLLPWLTPAGNGALTTNASNAYTLLADGEPVWRANYGVAGPASYYDRPGGLMRLHHVTGNVDWKERALRYYGWHLRNTFDPSYDGTHWPLPEWNNFDDSLALAILLWNHGQARTRGYEYWFKASAGVCDNFSFRWNEADTYNDNDGGNGPTSFRLRSRYLTLHTWWKRMNLAPSTLYNSQTATYWGQQWLTRIMQTFNGWDWSGTSGRVVTQFAGPGNVGTVEAMIMFHAGMLAESLAFYHTYHTALTGTQLARVWAMQAYMRTQSYTPSGGSPRLYYADQAFYSAGSDVPKEVDLFLDMMCAPGMAWEWRQTGNTAARDFVTQTLATMNATPQNGVVGPPITNGSFSPGSVGQKIYDETLRYTYQAVGLLYPRV